MRFRALILAAALASRGAFALDLQSRPGDVPLGPNLSMVQDFRRLAGLPALSPQSLNALAGSLEAAKAEQIEAAQALLSKVNPHFVSEITPETELLDSPDFREMRHAVNAARQTLAEAGVSQLREGLSDPNGISAAALEKAYTAPAHLTGLAADLPGINGDYVRDRIADGAPRQALEALSALKKHSPSLRSGERRERIERLLKALKAAPQSAAVSDFYAKLDGAEKLLSERRYGEALAAVIGLQDSARSAGLRKGTVSGLWLGGAALADKIHARGMSALYGARGPMTAAQLAEHVRSLPSGDYVGDLLPEKPVRIQCYSDCKIQQAYNHPQLSLVAEQMPYPSFLRALEGKLSNPDAHNEGLWDMETAFALRELGLTVTSLGSVKTEGRLVELLDRHGALTASIRFNPATKVKEGDTNHAVILQGAFIEDEHWKFVMIDSNHSRPQVFRFEELAVFNSRGYSSVEPTSDQAKDLPKALRGISDPAARMRKAVNLFYGNHGAVRGVVPWYKHLFWALANVARERFGLERVEPRPNFSVDSNLIPLGAKLPAKWQRALNRGLKLPSTAIVTAPDGRRFLNRLVIERLLAQKS